MNQKIILPFENISKEDIPIAGGKGANLGAMTSARLNVPAGFVITSEAYRSFLVDNNIDKKISQLLEEAKGDELLLESVAPSIRKLILDANFSNVFKEDVLKSYRQLGSNGRVAVRSSATAEDLPDASFAGQQETYLNVKGEEELLKAIQNCFASLWSKRSVNYRYTNGFNQKEVALAVVVQLMIESEKSGVLFTVNPVNQNHDEMQLNASYGLGEAVVSGLVSADEYICDKLGNVKSTITGDKKIHIVYSESGTIQSEVPAELQSKLCLSDDEVRAICKAGCEVENFYRMPMDIEWGIKDGIVYLLQARPITTLNNSVDDSLVEEYLNKCKLTGSMKENMIFLMEKMPMAYYPLDLVFMSAINSQKKVLSSEVGIDLEMDPIMDDLGVSILPPNDKKINKNIFHLFSMFKEILNFDYCIAKLDELLPRYQSDLDELSKVNYDNLSLTQCVSYTRKIHQLVCDIAYTRFRYSLFPGVLGQRKLDKFLKKLPGEFNSYDLYYNLDNKAAEISRDMVKLAQSVKSSGDANEMIEKGASLSSVLIKYPKLKNEVDTFLSKHGMKSDFNCYCVVAETFIETPKRLLHILKPLLNSPEEREEDQFTPLMNQIKTACGSEKKYKNISSQIDAMRKFHVAREESQYQWETAFYYERKVMRRASHLLTKNESLSDTICYMFIDEFYDACERGSICEKLAEKINKRKDMRPTAERVWEGAKYSLFDESGDILSGISGSSGEAIGKACIIHGPEEFYKLQKGDILVCPLTDPEWTPLFKVAAGVVADTGSSLSHAAIVAREYGIPAVLGVGIATRKYRDGDMIRISGTKGEVSNAR